jgi:DNA-directed RNA polymerase specialized sigma24 family protein
VNEIRALGTYTFMGLSQTLWSTPPGAEATKGSTAAHSLSQELNQRAANEWAIGNEVTDVTAANDSSRSATPSTANEQRFAEFVLSSRDQLLRALRTHLSPEYALEALADAYAYCWKRWPEIETLNNKIGYTYRIAERSGTRAEMRDRKHASDFQLSANPNAEPVWFDHYQSDDTTIAILRDLPTRQRACVLLIHGYGWTYKQTAEVLDLPLTTVTNEATRGLQRLRANSSLAHPSNIPSNEPPNGSTEFQTAEPKS